MANIIREVLTAQGMKLPLFTGGLSRGGISVSGTWAGTLSFFYSQDGVNFSNTPLSARPFPPGTSLPATVQQATGNGNWDFDVQNFVAVAVVATTLTSGSPVVAIGASTDSSYQDVFLLSTSKFVSQKVGGGAANTVTQPAQSNRAWRARTVSIGFSAPPSAAVDVQITDGASAVLWEGFVPKQDVSSGGFTWLAPLPADSDVPGLVGGGVVGTPGNPMSVVLAGPGGSVTSTINVEFAAA